MKQLILSFPFVLFLTLPNPAEQKSSSEKPQTPTIQTEYNYKIYDTGIGRYVEIPKRSTENPYKFAAEE
jgi:hypothetical protein